MMFKSFLPSLLTNSDFELADNERNRAAEFGRYVSNEADNSINGFKIPYFIWKEKSKTAISWLKFVFFPVKLIVLLPFIPSSGTIVRKQNKAMSRKEHRWGCMLTSRRPSSKPIKMRILIVYQVPYVWSGFISKVHFM